MPPRAVVVPAAWLTVLLCAPAAAWLAGARQPELEQQPKAPFPAINRSSLPNSQTYPRLDAAFLDRLPLREHALEARGRVALQLFSDSPTPAVLLGRDDWLFYREELRACADPAGRPGPDPADAAEILARTLVESGRRAAVVVAGSKVVAEPARVRGVARETIGCVAAVEAAIQDRLAQTPGGLDLRTAMRDAQRTAGSAFLRYDTHWNGAGQLAFAGAVLEQVRPGLAAEVGLTAGRSSRWTGDLGRLAGVRLSEPLTPATALRPPDPAPSGVLLLGDSQLERALTTRPGGAGPTVQEVALPGAARCTWPQYDDGRCDVAFSRATTVVVERVGRNARELGTGCWRGVSLAAAALRGTPSRWQRQDGSAPTRRLSVSGDTAVKIVPAGGQTSPLPRLLRLPVLALPAGADVKLIQQPQNGNEAPCATPLQTQVGRALLLPIPAGRPAADFQVTLQAPAGTVLGAPEEILLDGQPGARR